MKIKQQSALYVTDALRGMLASAVKPAGFAPLSVELLSEIVDRIVAGADPEKIVLFGSYAWGKPTADSDLDLLVIMETSARLAERVLLVSRHLRPRPFPMDILVRTPQEVKEAVEQRDGFIEKIMRNGEVLYDRQR